MKKISPIQIWTPEGIKNADTIKIRLISDDLKTNINTYYEIGYEHTISEKSDDKIFISLVNGEMPIDGQDYDDLDTVNGIDINEEIKRIIISKLNLTIA